MELENTGGKGARIAPPHAAPATQRRMQMTGSDGISVTCHENDVPDFVDSELDRLYGNLYSSLKRWRVYGGIAGASTWVARRGSEIVCVWLFSREKNTVRVINEGMRVDAGDAERFARHVFLMFPEADAIEFHAVESRIDRLAFPYQHFNCLEDIVLALPSTVDQYRAALGKATRSYISRYMNRMRRSFPDMQHTVDFTSDIREQQIRDIVALHQMRMREKGKASDVDEEEIMRIVRCAKESGMVCTIVLQGRIIAGTINFSAGRNCFLSIIGHDPAYNEYRPGTLCCYLTICECIARGYGEYHFLWGENDYKYRLLGTQRKLDDLVLYRSRAALVSNADKVLKNICRDRLRRMRLFVRRQLRKDVFLSRLAAGWLRQLRAR